MRWDPTKAKRKQVFHKDLDIFWLKCLHPTSLEDYFDGSFKFLRMWVGPHSAWKLKPCSSSNQGNTTQRFWSCSQWFWWWWNFQLVKFSVVGFLSLACRFFIPAKSFWSLGSNSHKNRKNIFRWLTFWKWLSKNPLPWKTKTKRQKVDIFLMNMSVLLLKKKLGSLVCAIAQTKLP